MLMTFFLLFILTAFFIIVGKIIAGNKGMIIAFVLACFLNLGAYWFSDSIILSTYRAQPAPAGHRLERITHDLARRAGMPLPKVYILPGASPNAFATGRSPGHAAVAATEGILAIMNDGELSAVMAHEMGHVKNYDMLSGSVAATISGAVMILSRTAIFFGGGSNSSFGKRLAVSILAPLAATVITMAISRDREYKADEFSARLTKRPMDLAGALQNLERGVRRAPLQDGSPQTAHMFTVHPFSASSIGELFSTHPPVAKRVERLAQLAREIQ